MVSRIEFVNHAKECDALKIKVVGETKDVWSADPDRAKRDERDIATREEANSIQLRWVCYCEDKHRDEVKFAVVRLRYHRWGMSAWVVLALWASAWLAVGVFA